MRVDSKIWLEDFQSNLNLVKKYISESERKTVTRIEFRTFDEGMCDANLFTCLKSEVKNQFDAFVTLCNYQRLFHDGWLLGETNSERSDSIVNLWMQPEIEGYSFELLSGEQVHREIDWIIDAILKILHDSKNSEKLIKDPRRWGIYVDGKVAPAETSLKNLDINKITSGIGFDLDWNSIQIMYETPSAYVFFSWSTGA